jgi:UDP-N-acetylglucosamine--N-acetylmuramyl-(pentapeptide) pyrophosphoryl-undecaprenol N-acetylglucosamine transferase
MGAVKVLLTGTHSTPAIALIEEIKKNNPSWGIVYCAPKYAFEGKRILSFDYLVVSKISGVKFVPIITGRVQRKFTIWTIPSLFKLPLGFFQALKILVKEQPSIIVSFGGYVSVPLVVVGWFLRIPSITHEQTPTVGLANRINSFFVKKIALSFPETPFPKVVSKKVVLTGNLLRNEIFNKDNPGELAKVADVYCKTGKKIIYITGGKTGAQAINSLVEKILDRLVSKYIVVHQTGLLDSPKFKKIKDNLTAKKKRFYYPVDYLGGEEVGWVLNNCLLVISRAGANTVQELMATCRPAILIPLPKSYQDEQKKNANYFSSLRLGKVIYQEKASAKLLWETVEEMNKQIDQYRREFSKVKVINGRKKLLSLIEEVIFQ